jgi:hypothetical protein
MDQSNYATSVHPIRREFVQVGQCPPICLEVTCITSAAFQAGSAFAVTDPAYRAENGRFWGVGSLTLSPILVRRFPSSRQVLTKE